MLLVKEMKMSNLPYDRKKSKMIIAKEPQELATVKDLQKYSTEELIEEIIRLQRCIRQALIFAGKRKETPSSEYRISMHFLSEILQSLELAEQGNLK